jgi:hypothetical protein
VSHTTSARRWLVVVLTALAAAMTVWTSAPAHAAKSAFFEETAQAFWAVPYTCADGSVVEGTLLVESTRDFSSPDKEDQNPTARVQFLAVCPDGTSFSWIAPAIPATITSAKNLKRVTASGSGIARDNSGGTHEVSFNVTWTGVGSVVTTVNGPGSKTQQRAATATGQVTFDGVLIADGPANHPTRPAPFIRVNTEK